MTGWNLVANHWNRTQITALAALVAAIATIGCSQMKPTSLKDLGRRPLQNAATQEFEKAKGLQRLYDESPEEFDDISVESAVASGQAEIGTELPEIELTDEGLPTLTTPRLQAIAAKPKLPHAEPIDPTAIASQEPPAEVVSQPLSPIVDQENTIHSKDNAIAKKSVASTQTGFNLGDENKFSKSESVEAYTRPADTTEPGKVIHLTSSPASTQLSEDVTQSQRRSPPEMITQAELDLSLKHTESHQIDISSNRTSSRESRTDRVHERPAKNSEKQTIVVDPSQFTKSQFGPELVPPFAAAPPPDDHLQTSNNDRVANRGTDFKPPKLDPNQFENSGFQKLNSSQQFTAKSNNDFSSDSSVVKATNTFDADVPAKTMTFSDMSDAEFEQMFGIKTVVVENPCTKCQDSSCMCESQCESNDREFQTMETRPSDRELQPEHSNPSNDFQPLGSNDFGSRETTSDFQVQPAAAFIETANAELETKTLPELDLNSKAIIWQTQIDQAIELIQDQIHHETDQANRESQEVKLKWLGLLNRNVKAVLTHRPTTGEREAWDVRLDAILAMLPVDNSMTQANGNPKMAVCQESLVCLKKAVEQLEALIGLQLRNASFCTEVKGFGQVTPFASLDFRPTEKVLVYCEVENYISSEIETAEAIKFLTRLQGSFSITDARTGEIAQSGKFPVIEDISSTKRQDFYVYFPIEFANLPPGNYQLNLEVKDLTNSSQTTIEPSLGFTVR